MKKILLIIAIIPIVLRAEDIYLLATKVAKIREVKDIIRKERRLFASLVRYFIDMGEWPRDGDSGGWDDLNNYLTIDTGHGFDRNIYGRELDFKIDRYYKIVKIFGGNSYLDEDQLLIYKARPEARDSNETTGVLFLFEKLDRKGVIGAQTKFLVIDPPPISGVTESSYHDGTIGYGKFYIDDKVYWRKFVVSNGVWVRVR